MTVLITGANRGIGQALRREYHARGDRVIATTRDAAPASAVDWITLDVTDPAGFADAAAALDGVAVDLLVCNAGVYLDKGDRLPDGYAPGAWAQTFAVNVTGVFLTVQSLLTNLQLSAAPKIAIISSAMGSDARAPGGSYIYRASKAAALNLGRNLATDLAPLGISVGIYHPGWVQTEMGGDEAEIDVTTAARGLADRFAALGPATTGCFESWDGQAVPF